MVGNAVMIISWKRFHSSLLSVGALWKIHVCDMKYFQIFCRNAVSSSIKYLKSSFCSSKIISNAYSMECLSNGRSYALPILNFLADTDCRMYFNDRGRVLSFFWRNFFKLNRLLSSTATYFAYVITKCWKFVPIPC